MNKYIKSAVASLLVLVIVLTTYLPTFAVSKDSNGQPTKYSSSYNSGERDVVATTLNGTSALKYYGDNYNYDKLSSMSSTELKNSLSTLMKNTHTYTSSYDDCHYKADRTDCENEDKSVSLIYTDYSATMSQWNGWNREHVWPKSLGGNNTSGGGADLHHIRPSDAVVNSTRGNKKYGNAPGGTAKYGSNPATGYLGGYYNSTYFEPLDNVKGDVARICLYVYVRWGSAWGADSITEVFQSVDVLLEWMLIDPVDTWELGRNEVVQSIQGNRNVFIDYPEYAWLIFGKQVPANLVSPSGEASNGNQGGNQGGSTHTHSYTSSITTQPTCTSTGVKTYNCSCGASYTETLAKKNHSFANGICTVCGASDGSTPACKHENTVIKDKVNADCHNDGYTGDVYCQSCGDKIATGSVIPSTNAHTYGDWQQLDDGSYEKHCTACGASVTLNFDTLLADVESDAEKILILLTLGVNDSILLDTLGNN